MNKKKEVIMGMLERAGLDPAKFLGEEKSVSESALSSIRAGNAKNVFSKQQDRFYKIQESFETNVNFTLKLCKKYGIDQPSVKEWQHKAVIVDDALNDMIDDFETWMDMMADWD